jgi:hypothetical protein
MARSIRRFKGKLNGTYTTIKGEHGIVTYTCKAKHPGLPRETYATGSRRKIRQHLMEDLNFAKKDTANSRYPK